MENANTGIANVLGFPETAIIMVPQTIKHYLRIV